MQTCNTIMSIIYEISAFVARVLGNVSLIQWTAGLVILLTWFYFHMTKDYGKWEKKGMFSIKPTFLFGNNGDLIMERKSLNEFHLDQYRQHKEHG